MQKKKSLIVSNFEIVWVMFGDNGYNVQSTFVWNVANPDMLIFSKCLKSDSTTPNLTWKKKDDNHQNIIDESKKTKKGWLKLIGSNMIQETTHVFYLSKTPWSNHIKNIWSVFSRSSFAPATENICWHIGFIRDEMETYVELLDRALKGNRLIFQENEYRKRKSRSPSYKY